MMWNLNYEQKYIATVSLDKVHIRYVTTTHDRISSLILWYLLVSDFLDPAWQNILLRSAYLYNLYPSLT